MPNNLYKYNITIPLSRINEFWSDPTYVEEPEMRKGHTLIDGAEWVAEVIWQDIDAPLIRFIISPDGKMHCLRRREQPFRHIPHGYGVFLNK